MAWINDAGGNDGVNSTKNLLKADGNKHGVLFLPMKALAVAAGWTVEGTGDGAGLYEFRGATAGNGTGSGGAYDVWSTNTNVSDGTAGNVSNIQAWCVLKDPAGNHEILLQGTSQVSSGFDPYGSMTWLDGGGYLAAGVSAIIPPAAVTDERFLVGGRPTGSGSAFMAFSGNSRFTLRFETSLKSGVYPFYYFSVTDPGLAQNFMQYCCPLQMTQASETAGYCFFSQSGGSIAKWEARDQAAERWLTNTNWLSAVAFNAGFWNSGSNDDPVTGKPVVGQVLIMAENGVFGQEYVHGLVTDYLTMSGSGSPSVTYPDLSDQDPDGNVWVKIGVAYWLPWDESGGTPLAPLPGTSTTVPLEYIYYTALAAPGGGVVATYVNRVWDTVAGPAFVRWNTSNTADPTGTSYPGPGTFGVDTSDYCVESIL